MLEEKVKKTIIKYNLIQSGDKIILGVSGGPDSICMLFSLKELSKVLNFQIVVAHINHGIRKNAKLDEKYVEELCKKLKVKYYVLHTNITQIAKQEKKGLEEVGRTIRYKFLIKF